MYQMANGGEERGSQMDLDMGEAERGDDLIEDDLLTYGHMSSRGLAFGWQCPEYLLKRSTTKVAQIREYLHPIGLLRAVSLTHENISRLVFEESPTLGSSSLKLSMVYGSAARPFN